MKYTVSVKYITRGYDLQLKRALTVTEGTDKNAFTKYNTISKPVYRMKQLIVLLFIVSNFAIAAQLFMEKLLETPEEAFTISK